MQKRQKVSYTKKSRTLYFAEAETRRNCSLMEAFPIDALEGLPLMEYTPHNKNPQGKVGKMGRVLVEGIEERNQELTSIECPGRIQLTMACIVAENSFLWEIE